MKPALPLQILFMIFRVIYRLLPRRSKRAMYLTSMYFYLVKEGLFRNMTLRQFSKHAQIDMATTSMKLPLASKEYIWGETGISQELQESFSHCPINALGQCPTEGDMRALSEKIVDAAPTWLGYDRNTMITDTMRVLQR